jgi:hypothetical protein
VKLFDCNASVGVGFVPAARYSATAGELREELGLCGIEGALVTCAAARPTAC